MSKLNKEQIAEIADAAMRGRNYFVEKYNGFISRLQSVVKRMDIEIARDEPSSAFVDGHCDGMISARRFIAEEFPELKTLEGLLAEVTDENKHELEEK